MEMSNTYPVQEPRLQAREGCRPPPGRKIWVRGHQAVPGAWHRWTGWPTGEVWDLEPEIAGFEP